MPSTNLSWNIVHSKFTCFSFVTPTLFHRIHKSMPIMTWFFRLTLFTQNVLSTSKRIQSLATQRSWYAGRQRLRFHHIRLQWFLVEAVCTKGTSGTLLLFENMLYCSKGYNGPNVLFLPQFTEQVLLGKILLTGISIHTKENSFLSKGGSKDLYLGFKCFSLWSSILLCTCYTGKLK